jgi:hypothetical protein
LAVELDADPVNWRRYGLHARKTVR